MATIAASSSLTVTPCSPRYPIPTTFERRSMHCSPCPIGSASRSVVKIVMSVSAACGEFPAQAPTVRAKNPSAAAMVALFKGCLGSVPGVSALHAGPFLARPHRQPGLPGDAEDHERNGKADQGICDRRPQRDPGGAADDAERDESVGASVVAIGDERGALEAPPRPKPHPRRGLVSKEANRAGGGEGAQVRERLRVDEALDRLPERDAGAHEDGEDDKEPGNPLAACRAKEEGDSERKGGQRVAEVVDQVGEQGHASADDVDGDLGE